MLINSKPFSIQLFMLTSNSMYVKSPSAFHFIVSSMKHWYESFYSFITFYYLPISFINKGPKWLLISPIIHVHRKIVLLCLFTIWYQINARLFHSLLWTIFTNYINLSILFYTYLHNNDTNNEQWQTMAINCIMKLTEI